MGVFKNRANLLLGVIIALAAALLFTNLDNHYLWQDEAQTALIAATVLERGVPLGYDGKNYFSQEGGAEYGPDYIWKWHPWFPFYYLALFFGLFGVSTFTARLPFVLIALLTVVLTYAAGRSLWQCRRAGLSAALLLSCT
ncbi:MAG: glycosyltransferase, partial [Deltaproteobacteria bacterium]|nr:glycosyltransferase [Deltaproteobacteria bacterium]